MCPDIAISSGLDDEEPEVRRDSIVSRRLPSPISHLARDITSISELLQFVSSWHLSNTCSRLNIMIEGDISRRYYLFVQRKTRVYESPFLLPSLKTTTFTNTSPFGGISLSFKERSDCRFAYFKNNILYSINKFAFIEMTLMSLLIR